MKFYETDRLILRAWREEDRQAFYQINSDMSAMQFMPQILTRKESDELANRIEKFMGENSFGLWALEHKADNRFIGFTGLSIPQFEAFFTPCVEIGWRLHPSFWGRGLAPEAALKSLEIGFEQPSIDEIFAFTATNNTPSIRVMEKIGMVKSPQNFEHPNVEAESPLKEHVLYRITREMFNS